MKNRLQGVVFFFINVLPDLDQDIEETVNMIKTFNGPLVQKIHADGRYVCMFVPTTKEATRIQKVDFNAPFPRLVGRSLDVMRFGARAKQLPFRLTGETSDNVLCGVITLFVNFQPGMKNVKPQEILEFIRNINKEPIQILNDDGRYDILIVPTTKEASRVEKVDYDSPFPRFVSIPSKVTPVPVPVSVQEKQEDFEGEEEEDEEDEEAVDTDTLQEQEE